jgi:hypothetical protein
MTEQAFLELLPATIVEARCGDDIHRLRWHAGDLTSLDHEDPDGERTLAALGGTSNGCVTALDAWQRQRTSLRLLTFTSRGAADRLRVERDDDDGPFSGSRPGGVSSRRPTPAAYSTSTSMARGWATYGPGAPGRVAGAAADEDDDVEALLGLGPALTDRLAATVATHWAQRVETGATTAAERPALQAALTGRVWLAAHVWTGLPLEAVDVRMADPTEAPAATYNDGRLTVAVPFRWLSRVWAPGLAVLTGRLALDAQLEAGSVTLSAVEPDGTPARTTIRL